MYTVYLIQHTDTQKLYIGVANDLKRRIAEHNAGGIKYTTRKEGVRILIYAEAYRAKEDAYQRERKLKAHGTVKYALLKRLIKSMLENQN